ncbi:MAG: ROK family protein [Verrucomicrobia bacterium]|nr:ROK family protein [Verrucomicrobiota bacterium]
MHRIGIDFGGTKIEGIVLDAQGREQTRKRIPTEQAQGYESIVTRIGALCQELAAQVGGPHTIGVGIPGAISLKTGCVKGSNTVCTIGRPLQQDLERAIGKPIGIMNDANCFAMAEAILGAGRGKQLVFGVIMGTGCGGGIVFDGKVLNGLQSIAGEWGHMSINPAGPLCYCKSRGCVETYISGGGLQQRYAEQVGTQLTFMDIVARYRAGDPATAAFMQQFFEHFGRAVANLIAVLDPDIIVLGGGVSNFDELYTSGVAEVAKRIFSDSLETPIVKHQIGDSAGVIGAALIGV